MSSTKNEMFPVFTRIYKRIFLYFLIAIFTTMGLASAIIEFVYGDLLDSVIILFVSIGWNAAIFFPSIRKITRSEKSKKKNIVQQNTALNKHIALAERIISLLAIIVGIAGLIKAATSGYPLYYFVEGLWITILGASHFSFIFVTILLSEELRRRADKEKAKRA